MTEHEKNQQVADEICRTRQWKDRTFGRGEYVLLLDGEVHAVGESLYDMMQVFEETGADTSRGMVFEVTHPVVDVIR